MAPPKSKTKKDMAPKDSEQDNALAEDTGLDEFDLGDDKKSKKQDSDAEEEEEKTETKPKAKAKSSAKKDDKDEKKKTPAKPKTKSESTLFKGLTIIVDVSNGEDGDSKEDSDPVKKKLEENSAKVIGKWSDNVTHVVFMNGKPAMWKRSKDEDSKVKFVTPAWVEESIKKNVIQPVDKFPASEPTKKTPSKKTPSKDDKKDEKKTTTPKEKKTNGVKRKAEDDDAKDKDDDAEESDGKKKKKSDIPAKKKAKTDTDAKDDKKTKSKAKETEEKDTKTKKAAAKKDTTTDKKETKKTPTKTADAKDKKTPKSADKKPAAKKDAKKDGEKKKTTKKKKAKKNEDDEEEEDDGADDEDEEDTEMDLGDDDEDDEEEEETQHDEDEIVQVDAETGKRIKSVSPALFKRKSIPKTKYVIEFSDVAEGDLLLYTTSFNEPAFIKEMSACTIAGENYSGQRFTHLIVKDNKPKRTLKVLFAIAYGAKIVTKEWLNQSIDKQEVVAEDKYIIDKWQDACERSRQAHKNLEDSKKRSPARKKSKGKGKAKEGEEDKKEEEEDKDSTDDEASHPSGPFPLLHQKKIAIQGNTDPSADVISNLINSLGGEKALGARAANFCIVGKGAPVSAVTQNEKCHAVSFKWLAEAVDKYELPESVDEYKVTEESLKKDMFHPKEVTKKKKEEKEKKPATPKKKAGKKDEEKDEENAEDKDKEEKKPAKKEEKSKKESAKKEDKKVEEKKPSSQSSQKKTVPSPKEDDSQGAEMEF